MGQMWLSAAMRSEAHGREKSSSKPESVEPASGQTRLCHGDAFRVGCLCDYYRAWRPARRHPGLLTFIPPRNGFKYPLRRAPELMDRDPVHGWKPLVESLQRLTLTIVESQNENHRYSRDDRDHSFGGASSSRQWLSLGKVCPDSRRARDGQWPDRSRRNGRRRR